MALKAPNEQDIIQIDITNACFKTCSNCTRFCGHHAKPFFMDFDTFQAAVDSVVDYPGMVGIMGGSPELHPHFAKLITYYAAKIGPTALGAQREFLAPITDFTVARNRYLADYHATRRGLWTALGPGYYKHYELIQDVFNGYQCINDHQHEGMHQPLLVGYQELGISDAQFKELRDNCWINQKWSASITPKGVFFCEVAAAMDMLFHGPGGLPITPGWWQLRTEQFGDQLDWCKRCSAAIPLPRRRATEGKTDMSHINLTALQAAGGRRLDQVVVVDTKDYSLAQLKPGWQPNMEWYLPKDGNSSQRAATAVEQLHPRHLDMIITCRNYSDYLDHTLPLNRSHVDRLLVVTSPDDVQTPIVCARHGVSCLVSTRMTENGAVINKGKGINDALASLEDFDGCALDWVLSADADVILPTGFRAGLNQYILNPGVLYGAARHEPNIASTPAWIVALPTSPRHGLGIANMRYDYERGRPDGYFQLFNMRAKALHGRRPIYFEDSNTAEKDDAAFARLWPKSHWCFLDKALEVAHIPHRIPGVPNPLPRVVSVPQTTGVQNSYRRGNRPHVSIVAANNWHGRKSPPLAAPTWTTVAPVPASAGWVEVFHGSRPDLWNTGLKVGNDYGAILPNQVRSLKIEHLATRQSVQIELNGEPGANVTLSDGRIWHGQVSVAYNGIHLGLGCCPRLPLTPVASKGKVSIHMDGKIEYGGWGFGHRMFMDDQQGFAVDGQAVGDGRFRISIR